MSGLLFNSKILIKPGPPSKNLVVLDGWQPGIWEPGLKYSHNYIPECIKMNFRRVYIYKLPLITFHIQQHKANCLCTY